jgi:putative transposase
MRTLHKNSNVAWRCTYHVVWCSKYRRKILVDNTAKRLKQIIQDVAAEHKVTIRELEIMPDHVHLLMDVDPQFGVHKAIKRMKGRSSRFLRREFRPLRSRLPTLWSNSYFVSTVGGAPLAVIKQYINDQSRSDRY